MKKKKRGC